MDLHLLRSMIVMTPIGGKNLVKNNGSGRRSKKTEEKDE
jgi:hypothetical protein